MHLTHIRDLAAGALLPSSHAFLSAASGMVVCGSMLCVVADDAHCLALFDLDGVGPGRLVPLIADDLPSVAAQRKRMKPDFEILLALPAAQGCRLLALGSGSTARRMRGAMIDLPGADGPGADLLRADMGRVSESASVRLINLRALFAALAPLVPAVNLEGAVLSGDRLLLFNRGTMTHPASHIIEVPLAAVLSGGPVAATLCATMTLPALAGVPLTVTDACRLDTGTILLSAVAEATTDSYADGALVGAAIVELDAAFTVRVVTPLEPVLKVEGIAARSAADGVHLLCVTDADDPDRAAGLYEGVLV